jgi:hypothetical protein
VIVAWTALLLIVDIGGGLLVDAIIVGVTVFFLVIVAKFDQLSAVPANVYGYAAAVAYSLHQASAPGATPDVAGTGPLFSLTSPNSGNPLVILIVAMFLGAVLGYISGVGRERSDEKDCCRPTALKPFWPAAASAAAGQRGSRGGVFSAGATEKILQQIVAAFRQHGLRVELKSDDKPAAVPQGHDLALFAFRRDHEIVGQSLLCYHEGVVASCTQRIGQAGEDAEAAVADERGLAMHRPTGADDLAAECLTDALVPKADAEDWNPRAEAFDQGNRDSGLVRRAWTGRDDNMRRRQAFNRLEIDAVVADDVGRPTQLADIAGEVVDERVVVVDEEDHGASSGDKAAIRACALASVSAYSAAGVESATMPPPA